ncbi:hypothetical protein [Cupriavidus sp. 8B]
MSAAAASSVRSSATACSPFWRSVRSWSISRSAALGRTGPLLRDDDLLALAFQFRRELGTQITQLPLERLSLALPSS